MLVRFIRIALLLTLMWRLKKGQHMVHMRWQGDQFHTFPHSRGIVREPNDVYAL